MSGKDLTIMEIKDLLLKEGKSIIIKGFGTFNMKDKAARKARNPKTGEAVDVPAQKTLKFSVSHSFRRELNPGVNILTGGQPKDKVEAKVEVKKEAEVKK